MENILFEDKDILVCYKPAGLATQTARATEQDMVSVLRNYRKAAGEEPYIGVVHRLDQPVEGLLVFAKHKAGAADLSSQIQQRTFCKEYLAVVSGELSKEGQLEDYLLRDRQGGCAKVVSAKTPGARSARLSFHVLETQGAQQLVSVLLHTGRFHQIRAQLAHAGAPILGDVKYGGRPTRMPLALCASRLTFAHPATGERQSFCVKPAGEAFQNWNVIHQTTIDEECFKENIFF